MFWLFLLPADWNADAIHSGGGPLQPAHTLQRLATFQGRLRLETVQSTLRVPPRVSRGTVTVSFPATL